MAPTEYISVRRKPVDEKEAAECLELILSGGDGGKWFTRSLHPAERAERGDWGFVQWHQPDLERIVQELESHPSLTALNKVAELGPTAQQSRGSWVKSEDGSGERLGFWTLSSDVRKKLADRPETSVRSKSGKRLDWTRENGKASCLLFAASGRVDSGRVLAWHSPEPSFGSACLPVLMHEERHEPAIAGWCNSTPGRLLYLNRRASKLDFPRYAQDDLATLPVPAGPEALNALGEVVERCGDQEVAQGRDGAACLVRKELDKAAALALGESEETVAEWRRMLAMEPTVSGRRIPIEGEDSD